MREHFQLFKGPAQRTRFNKFKHLKFVGEKAFTLYEDTIEGIQEELERRDWIKLNGLMRDANSSMAVEFFSNAYQENEHDQPFEFMVRGVKVKFDEETINDMLCTSTPFICGIEERRKELDKIKIMEEIRKLEKSHG